MKRMLRSVAFAMVLIVLLPIGVRAAEFLIPVGELIGLQLRDDRVIVAAFDDVLGSRAQQAGLKIGDEIVAVDGYPADCAGDISAALEDCADTVILTVRRGKDTHTLTMEPTRTTEGPRLGVCLRQGIAGIGTVTWYDPETGKFGALGHGVSNAEGSLMNMTGGEIFEAEIVAVKKGRSGEPGQLKGTAEATDILGTLYHNTPQGVFGAAKRPWKGEAIRVAEFPEIRTGEATILSTVDSGGPREYSVEILKIYPQDRTDNRNFLLKVTDPALLEATGGIVQGMSGSPIIQDGKLIGAVTHVLVNDPTRGYGIFIENMLDAAG